MKKIKLVVVLTGMAALVTVVLILFLPNPHNLSVGKSKVEQLPKGQPILGSAWPEIQSVQKGDTFLYLLGVLYDPSQVSEIDRESIDDNVNLAPFEIRGVEETEYNLDSGTRLYQRQYEIQLISGETEHLYEFPTIVVRYELKGADGFAETSVMPEPIYVAPRIPASILNTIINDLNSGYDPFRPLEGKIEDMSQNRLPWILLILGGFLVVLTATDLTLRVIPQWREKSKQVRKMEMSDFFRQAYSSLRANVVMGAKPKSLFNQMDHILRVILSPKEKVGWLEELNLDLVPVGIKPSVISLFEKCEGAYGTEDVKQEEVEEALRQLREILEFYFAEEVEAWESYPNS